MINVRIVYSYDAEATAEDIQYHLLAEGFAAEIINGREYTGMIASICDADYAIVLVWSKEAPATDYMQNWARAVDPAKLAEVVRWNNFPHIEGRRANPIDFTRWNRHRDDIAWRALETRLRNIGRAFEPKKNPSAGPMAVMMAASAAAVVGGAIVRSDQEGPMIVHTLQPQSVAQATNDIARAPMPGVAAGGPLAALEPASIDTADEPAILRRPRRQLRGIEARTFATLSRPRDATAPLEYKEASIFERLSEWTSPLVGADEDN